MTAYDTKTGEWVYRQRVGAGAYTALPIAADGKLYFTTEEGDVVVARLVGLGLSKDEYLVRGLGQPDSTPE